MKFPEKFRVNHNINIENVPFNFFIIPFRGRELQVIATTNPSGWEQISVSLETRNPNWDEMSHIKSLFFEDEEMCFQFHPKKSEYVNIQAHCLHIWKPPVEISCLFDGK